MSDDWREQNIPLLWRREQKVAGLRFSADSGGKGREEGFWAILSDGESRRVEWIRGLWCSLWKDK